MILRVSSILLLLCIVAFPGFPASAKGEKVEQVVLVLWHGAVERSEAFTHTPC